MKVRCLGNKFTDEQKEILGVPEHQNPIYQLTIGKEYTVLGLSLSMDYMKGVMLEIQEDHHSYCVSIPLCLFEIIDPRISAYWRAKQNKHNLLLWPEEFYIDFFHDDLAEGRFEVKSIYDEVCKKMKSEFDEKAST